MITVGSPLPPFITHQVIELENRAPGGPELRYQSDTGEDIVIRKDNDNGRFTITSLYNTASDRT